VIAATLLDDPVFWRRVYETSSDILRISHHIANGHLAPTAKERAKAATTGGGAAQKPPDKAPPKAPPSENLDEDVPF
jgi:hypothetical protein